MESFDTFARVYRKSIADEIGEIEHSLGKGVAQTYDAYIHSVGKVDGLTIALSLFDTTIRKYAELEDEEDD